MKSLFPGKETLNLHSDLKEQTEVKEQASVLPAVRDTLSLKKPSARHDLRSDMPLPFDTDDLLELFYENERQISDIEMELELCDPEHQIGKIAKLDNKYKHLKILRMRLKFELSQCRLYRHELKKFKILVKCLGFTMSGVDFRAAEVQARSIFKEWVKDRVSSRDRRRLNKQTAPIADSNYRPEHDEENFSNET